MSRRLDFRVLRAWHFHVNSRASSHVDKIYFSDLLQLFQVIRTKSIIKVEDTQIEEMPERLGEFGASDRGHSQTRVNSQLRNGWMSP